MIKEEFVSFETAKLLKKKGFDIPVHTFYNIKGELHSYIGDMVTHDVNSEVYINLEFYNAPTQALVYRWLREKHLLNIDISIQNGGTWNYGIEDITCPFDGGIIPKHWDDGFKTYEEALEAGIQYCLKNLI